jgi:hypothetical protein
MRSTLQLKQVSHEFTIASLNYSNYVLARDNIKWIISAQGRNMVSAITVQYILSDQILNKWRHFIVCSRIHQSNFEVAWDKL